ncbi:unnamed protein product [marine sediment metagenome]|uniref:Class I SAM-dependent methyltransferase n=1 Tax=marine sediment metagenome TaxID=412755 RepID=X0VUT9_9ZZZZ
MVHEPITLDLTDRRSLMASLPKGGIGAEIGVSEGLFSEVLLKVCKPRRLHLIDPWTFITSDALRNDASNVCQEGQESRYTQVRQRLGVKREVEILREYSLVAVQTFGDGYFDWIYVDADHTQAGVDAEAWWPKVKSGGWLTGHDYTMAGEHITVKAQIDEFVARHGLELFVTRGDTDIYEKNYPSWAVRKP